MSSRLACALCAIALVGAALDAADVRVTVPGLAEWQAERTQAIACHVATMRELVHEEDLRRSATFRPARCRNS